MKYLDGLCHLLPPVKINWIHLRSRVLKILAAALAGITIVHFRKDTMLTTLTEFSLTMPVYMMDLVRIPLKKVSIHWSPPIESDRRNFKGTVLLHSIAIAANSPR